MKILCECLKISTNLENATPNSYKFVAKSQSYQKPKKLIKLGVRIFTLVYTRTALEDII